MPGANDGLASNLSLVTGVAVLLAGALSMAMGEWISVQSSRELYAYQIEVETQELALVHEAKGGPRVEAQALAERLMSDEDTALDAMVREELGMSDLEYERWCESLRSGLEISVKRYFEATADR